MLSHIQIATVSQRPAVEKKKVVKKKKRKENFTKELLTCTGCWCGATNTTCYKVVRAVVLV